ncbi:hypothetical protein [Vibrio brasiliensis]
MKKTFTCTALASALFLVGCGENPQGQNPLLAQLVVAEPVQYKKYWRVTKRSSLLGQDTLAKTHWVSL